MTKSRGLTNIVIGSWSCLAALALAAPVSVVAQETATGSRLKERYRSDGTVDEASTRKAYHSLAECTYAARSRTVDRYLTTTDPEDWRDAATAVNRPLSCEIFHAGANTESMTFANDPRLLRGLFAEAALKRNGKLAPSAQIAAANQIAAGYNKRWFEMTGRPAAVDAMAACMADSQPGLVVELLRADPATGEERAAIGKVAGLLGPCLREGAELSVNVVSLRSALAEAYFHRVLGPNEDIPPPVKAEPVGPGEDMG